MSVFLPALAVMTAIAVAAILWPLFRRRPPPARSSFELGIYRDQLAEIERDRERGLIGEDEAKAGRLEIERRILRAAPAAASDEPATGEGERRFVLAAALLVPVLVLGLYGTLGMPGMPDRPLALRDDRGGPNDPQQPDIQAMVAQLEQRLATSPNDLDGWLMLGRSHGVLGDMPASVDAYRKAQGLAPDDPRVLGSLAEALVASAQGVVTPEAKTLFGRLSEREPRDPRPDFYLGWADAQAGDYHAALDRWRRLLAATPAEAPWRPRLVEAVREAAQQLKLDPDTVLAQIPAPPAATSTAPQPSQEDVARAAAMSPEERQAMIRGMVDKLQARMDADGSDVEGWVRLAQSRLVLGEEERARATFEQGLKLHPEAPELLKGLAGSLLGPAHADTGLPEIGDRAAELYTRAANLRPDDPEPWWYLGIRALQTGDKAQARASWEKVLARLDPSRPEYAEIKGRLQQLGG